LGDAEVEEVLHKTAFQAEEERLMDLMRSGLRNDEHKIAPTSAQPKSGFFSEPPMPSSSLVSESKLKAAGWERMDARVSDPSNYPVLERRMANLEATIMSAASHMTALETKLAEIQSFMEAKFEFMAKEIRDQAARLRSLESESMQEAKPYDEKEALAKAMAESVLEGEAETYMDLDDG
jgi:hypothetical protein